MYHFVRMHKNKKNSVAIATLPYRLDPYHNICTLIHVYRKVGSRCILPLLLLLCPPFNPNPLLTSTSSLPHSPMQHSRSLKRANSSTSLDKDRRTKRLLAVLTYYTLFGTLAITHQSLELGNAPRLLAAVEESFTCEAAGGGDGRDNCPTRYVDYSYPAFGGVVYLLMGLIPTANMVFVLPAWQLWKYCRGGERGSTKGVREMKSSNSSTADL